MTRSNRSITLQGISISPGIASGKAFVFQDIFEREFKDAAIEMDQVEREFERLEWAVESVLEDLGQSTDRVHQALNSDMADIFRAHEEMLRDASLIHSLRTEIEEELVNAQKSVQRVFKRLEDKFRSMESEVLQQRGDDVADLGRRLLRTLEGVHTHSLETMPEGCILVARRLLPSDTTFFPLRSTAGTVVEAGGPGSHCALLTRQLGIPGVSQIPGLLDQVKTGDRVLLDGLRGRVIIRPGKDKQAQFNAQIAEYQATITEAKKRCHDAASTRDGVPITVMANIGNRHEAEMAVENGADGVGLFRMEVLFLSRSMLPTEKELAGEISRTIEPLQGKPVTVRLLDIGGDKTLPYLKLPHEANPFLGSRGIRLLIDHPELLKVQLLALLRVSRDHAVQILVPMVTFAEDMRVVRKALAEACAKRGIAEPPPLGAMIETPAAALCADEIAAESDFLNIGTNDLTQYTMAAGRENESVNRYFRDDHRAIFKLVSLICRDVRDKPIGLCGELASQTNKMGEVFRTGIRLLSVPPPFLPLVKEAVRTVKIKPGEGERNE